MKDKFFVYSAYEYNCQNFIMNILEANGLLNRTLQEFILQEFDLHNIKKNTSLYHLTNLVTDIDNVLNGRIKGGTLLDWY